MVSKSIPEYDFVTIAYINHNIVEIIPTNLILFVLSDKKVVRVIIDAMIENIENISL